MHDYTRLCEDLSQVNWTKLEGLNVTNAWDYLVDNIHNAMDKNIPKSKPFNAALCKKKRKPLWMCNEALAKVKKKYHAWKRYTTTKHYIDYQAYIKLRNEATKGVRSAKRQFERKLAQEIKENTKGFWNYVRSNTKVKSGISDLSKDDGTKTSCDEEKAEVLNSFYASVFTQEDVNIIPEPDTKFVGEPLMDAVILEEEVLKKLKNLKPTKSPGPDGLHPRVLKEAAEVLAKPLCTIFNKTVDEGRVPDGWKVAHVTAIYKKGKTTVPGNYRPVSLTSVVCKIMESLLRDRIMKYMDEQKILSDHQHGFRLEGRV
jgi:hypothetical protein